MAELKNKVQNALDEARMLILGAQVLFGFQYRAALEQSFEKLPRHTQYLKLGGLGLLLWVVALLILPGAYHRLAFEGNDSEELHHFSSRVMEIALLPFALGIGIDFYVAGERLHGAWFGGLLGVIVCLTALICWYGIELWQKPAHRAHVREGQMEQTPTKDSPPTGTELKDKIRHVLTEARTVLPGAQALLGFQFAALLMEGFEKLSVLAKHVHLASLILVALSTILLMTPAAYHRLVERGEETEHFHRLASRLLLAALVPLALGICGDFFVVLEKVLKLRSIAITNAVLALVMFFSLWFGLPLWKKHRSRASN